MATGIESGYIYTYNKSGQSSVTINATTDGHGGIWIYDKNGQHSGFYSYSNE
jgi:hypothetical protein